MFINSILAIFSTLIQYINCDCGVPGVPAFAQLVDFENLSKYPENYQIRYDCIDPHGLNINGDDKRTCQNNVWTPTTIPICDIADPDDGMSEFQIEILSANESESITKSRFHNNWSLYGSQDSYVVNLRKENNLIFELMNGSTVHLWRIAFAKSYPVETDHSFLVIMVFVQTFNQSLNNENSNSSQIDIQIESKFSSTNRTCRQMTQIDSIERLFTKINPNSVIANKTWENDIFHKILMECRINWENRPHRWQSTSSLEYFNGLNLSVHIDSQSPVELILTQLTVDVDCGYPDIPIGGTYNKVWMSAIIECTKGELIGDKNISCLYSGRWIKPNSVPKCCVENECEILTESKENSNLIIITVIVILITTVIVLAILLIVFILKSKKRQNLMLTQRMQSKTSSDNPYDDIDLNADETYEHLKQPDYYDQIEYEDYRTGSTAQAYNLSVYDNVQNPEDYELKRMSIRAMMSETDGQYLQMYKCDDYLQMTSSNKNLQNTNSMLKVMTKDENNYV